MSAKIPPLSGYLGELVRRGHGGAAVRLILEWGGAKRYIPKEPQTGSPLVDIVGMAAATVLAELTGGDYYDIPPRVVLDGESLKQQILKEDGTTREVAQKLGTTERHVRRVRKDGDCKPSHGRSMDSRQLVMFD
jgi:hypothetical protein